MSANQQSFSFVNYAERGYKILIIVYGQPRSAKSMFETSAPAAKLLQHCVRNVPRDQYILNFSTYTDIKNIKPLYRKRFIESIERGLSPIILDNVEDLTATKLFCEKAVKFGYLIDIFNGDNVDPLTKADLYIEFKLFYEVGLPQLRQHPTLPKQASNEEELAIDEAIRESIRTEYSLWMISNQQQKDAKTLKQNDVKNQQQTDVKIQKQNDVKTYTVVKVDKTDIAAEEQVSLTDLKDKNALLHREEPSSSGNISQIDQIEGLKRATGTTTIQGSSNNANNDQTRSHAPTNKEESKIDYNHLRETLQLHQAFVKSSEGNIDKKFEESKEAISKMVEDKLSVTKTIIENQAKLTEVMESVRRDVEKSLKENKDMLNKMMTGFLTQMEALNVSQVETLCKRIDEQLTIKMVANTVEISDDESEGNEKTNKPDGKSVNKGVIKKSTNKQHQKGNNLTPDIKINQLDEIVNLIKEGYKVMVLMRGLPGSGKTQLATELLEQSLGGVNKSEFILSTHDYFWRTGRFIYKSAELDEAHQYTQRKCFEAVKYGISPIIIDGTNLKILDMKVYCAMAVEFGYIVEIVEPKTPWAFDVAELAKKNTCNHDTRQIKRMLENYERNVLPQYLLKELNIFYKDRMPQFRTYPPLADKDTNLAVQIPAPIKKTNTYPNEYVHKFEMKHGQKPNDVGVSNPNDNTTTRVYQPKNNDDTENVTEVSVLRKQLDDQNQVIQSLMRKIESQDSRQLQNTPIGPAAILPRQEAAREEYNYSTQYQMQNYQHNYDDKKYQVMERDYGVHSSQNVSLAVAQNVVHPNKRTHENAGEFNRPAIRDNNTYPNQGSSNNMPTEYPLSQEDNVGEGYQKRNNSSWAGMFFGRN